MKDLQKALIDFLKGSAVKFAVKKLLGSSVGMIAGVKGWLIKYAITELFEEVAEPLINLAIRKGLLAYDKVDGKIKLKRLEKAKEENNEANYNTTIDDI
jgi:hypothetical protein